MKAHLTSTEFACTTIVRPPALRIAFLKRRTPRLVSPASSIPVEDNAPTDSWDESGPGGLQRLIVDEYVGKCGRCSTASAVVPSAISRNPRRFSAVSSYRCMTRPAPICLAPLAGPSPTVSIRLRRPLASPFFARRYFASCLRPATRQGLDNRRSCRVYNILKKEGTRLRIRTRRVSSALMGPATVSGRDCGTFNFTTSRRKY